MTCPDCGGSGEFEILNSGMGSAVCLVCGGTGDSGGVNMEQLWVADSYYDTGHALYRPATPAEVLAAAATLDGTVPLSSCAPHMSNGRGPRCDIAISNGLGPDTCRMVKGLWLPLPDKETTDES